MSARKKLKTPVVAIINMKGGVGKTTISAHVFGLLFSIINKNTILIDMDPQFNLTQTFLNRERYEQLKSSQKTIMAAMEPPPAGGIFQIKTGDAPPPSPDKLAQKLYYAGTTDKVYLTLLPGDFRLVKYCLMDDQNQLKKVKDRFIKFIELAKEENEIVCLDCNPSSSFLTLCALEVATHILVPVKPDKYSILGLEILNDFIQELPTLAPKPKTIVLLNDIPRSEPNTTVENELRVHHNFGSKIMASRIYRSKKLQATPEYTGLAYQKPGPYRTWVYENLSEVAHELRSQLGIS